MSDETTTDVGLIYGLLADPNYSQLLDLERAVQRCPVHIAGYGREATHKGWLSWMLDSGRHPGLADLSVDLACALIDEAHTASESPSPVDGRKITLDGHAHTVGYVACWEEKKVGGRKVDLLLWLKGGKDDPAFAAVPIELKVDSGLSGASQLADMSVPEVGRDRVLCDVVLLLGASSVLVPDRAGNKDLFLRLRHKELAQRWKERLDQVEDAQSGPEDRQEAVNLVGAYVKALRLEGCRQSFAQEAFESKSEVTRLGYRSGENHSYYLHAANREDIEDRVDACVKGIGLDEEVGADWHLFDGGYNAVFQPDHWTCWPCDTPAALDSLPEKSKACLIFEFHDRAFQLMFWKGDKHEKDPGNLGKSALEPWARSLREKIKQGWDDTGLNTCNPESPGRTGWSRNAFAILVWKDIPLHDSARTAEAVAGIIEQACRLGGLQVRER